jgi:hypothetical protein
LRRGFKTEAEEIALELRADAGLAPTEALDPFALARHWAVPLMPATELVAHGASPEDVNRACRCNWSAATLPVPPGAGCLVVYNDRHPLTRQFNSIAHELSHIHLGHDPSPLLGSDGEFQFDDDQEDEATWLAGTLLVPRDGVLVILRKDPSITTAAQHFQVSDDLLMWRARKTGVLRQIERARGMYR